MSRKNSVCKPSFESTSTTPTLSSLSFGCSTKEIKREIWEDNESISSGDESDDDSELGGFMFASDKSLQSQDNQPLICID